MICKNGEKRDNNKMRIRRDVKQGDLVIKNRGGWIVPITVSTSPIGEVVSVHQDGKLIPFGIMHSKDIDGKPLATVELW